MPATQLWYTLSVDLLHLIDDTAWLGGLLYIGSILIPTLFTLDARQRGSVLAQGLPEFSAFAIITVFLLTTTGSLNIAFHLTSLNQFLTTLYGRTLPVKISLFLLMTVISAYHAFYLRPRLTHMLVQLDTKQTEMAVVGARSPLQVVQEIPHEEDASRIWGVRRQAARLAAWLQIEALLGIAVLLCVALLGAFTGTLALSSSASSANAPNQPTQARGPFVQTQHAGGYILTLRVTPASFGTNTFTVTLQDAQGHPVQGAGVLLETQMLDMDMGIQTTQLQPVSSSPGIYSSSSDLTIAGHWQVILRILPPKVNTFIRYTFTFSAV